MSPEILTTISDRAAWETANPADLFSGRGLITRKEAQDCARRVRHLRSELREAWVLKDELGKDVPIIDWLLATVIAGENALLLGPPGVAKTDIATRIFEALGLVVPERVQDTTEPGQGSPAKVRDWWDKREADERRKHKFFHYLLGRFTQPEELFGPVEIGLLRSGVLARVNFGLLTGPGVRAAFLDEVFKASSSILNTLLTLLNERRYFNWGGMVASDLTTLIAASNELPGGFGGRSVGSGAAEDFDTMYAFLDRFAVRFIVPEVSETRIGDGRSSLEDAFTKAMNREGRRARSPRWRGFADRDDDDLFPCMNDVLLLGRACIEDEGDPDAQKRPDAVFNLGGRQKFRSLFLDLAQRLFPHRTRALGDPTWTLSPRKLKSLYKIALAHALLRDDGLAKDGAQVRADPGDLQVFEWIADTSEPEVLQQLRDLIASA